MMQKFEIMNDKLVENEVPQKSHKKLKIAIALVTSIAIIATTVILVGYFKFHWFQSEIYNVDANISRISFQTDYFTETKKVTTKTTFTSGDAEEKEVTLTTNFMVVQNEKVDDLNKASIFILDSRLKSEAQEKEINSFNVFDPETVNKVKENADGSKFPMAEIWFFDNGKIKDIKLPSNIDQHNANSIIELVESVVPKLTRNRTEDEDNGLEINTRKDKNKKTMVETQEPREVPNFRKSRFGKTIERDIEDGQITNIRTNSKLELTTQKENDDEISFGIQNFFFDQKSEIVLTKSAEEKDTTNLINKISPFFDLKSKEEVLKSFEKKEEVVEEWEEDIESPNSIVRNLGFSISNSNTYTLKTLNVLGTSIAIKLNVGVSGGKAFCKLIVGGASFGKDGITAEYSKTFGTGTITIFSFAFPAMPAISVGLTGEASITLTIKFASSAKTKLNFSLTGSVKANAYVKAGWDAVASITAGASGTLVSATISAGVQNSGITYSKSLSGGKIVAYIKGTALKTFQLFYYDYTLFNGW